LRRRSVLSRIKSGSAACAIVRECKRGKYDFKHYSDSCGCWYRDSAGADEKEETGLKKRGRYWFSIARPPTEFKLSAVEEFGAWISRHNAPRNDTENQNRPRFLLC